MAKVIEHTREEGGGRDGAGHHDDVEVRGDFFGGCCRPLRVEDVVHEVLAVILKSQAARRTFMLVFDTHSTSMNKGKSKGERERSTLRCALSRTRRVCRVSFCCERVETIPVKKIDRAHRLQHA